MGTLTSLTSLERICEIDHSFLNLLTCFSTSAEICYLTRYAEKNHRSPSTPWSVRQTGVYHAHNPHADFDLFILLHPTPSSVFETQLIGLTGSVLDDFVANPYMVHLLAFSSYLGNWRWYFRYLGEDFRRKNDDAFALDLQTSVATASTFDMVQGLRHLFDTTISLSAFCKADLSNLRALNDVEEAGFESLSLIRKLSEELDGYQESLSALSKRIQNAIDLVSPSPMLDLKGFALRFVSLYANAFEIACLLA